MLKYLEAIITKRGWTGIGMDKQINEIHYSPEADAIDSAAY